MNLDDRIFSKFRVTFQISQATTAKRMKIDPYCQRQNCSPLTALFSDVYIDYVDIDRRSSAMGI